MLYGNRIISYDKDTFSIKDSVLQLFSLRFHGFATTLNSSIFDFFCHHEPALKGLLRNWKTKGCPCCLALVPCLVCYFPISKAQWAAPSRAALSLRMTLTGILTSNPANLPLSIKAFINKSSSRSFGKIFGAIPPPR